MSIEGKSLRDSDDYSTDENTRKRRAFEEMEGREDQKVFNKEINHLKEENEKLKKENNIIKKELTNIKKELVDVKNEMNWIEKDKKKNRVVVKGLQINTSDTEVMKNSINNFIKEHLKIGKVYK
ncbi:hypothetical protein QE152_g24665 [Popillia japonica]|uniref:Uncharacterized protein n=1 Tax=Popillia japonica TaxID=7064 RepID=A0AAW1K6J6_POPJA